MQNPKSPNIVTLFLHFFHFLPPLLSILVYNIVVVTKLLKTKGEYMNKLNSYQQLVFNKNLQSFSDFNKPFNSSLISILDSFFDIEPFISSEFQSLYYSQHGTKRTFSLSSMLKAFILKNIAGYSSFSKFISFLYMCKEARQFCGFYSAIPNNSQFSRFKTSFASSIQELFMKLSISSEHIFTQIDPKLASTLILDTSGILPFVKENNPKFFYSNLNKVKTSNKGKPSSEIYSFFYNSLPKFADSQKHARVSYINGGFHYSIKFAILTNGFGIPRYVQLIDKEFSHKHQILKHCFTNNPINDKMASDSAIFLPVLNDFFKYQQYFSFSTFMADSAFDKVDYYTSLFENFHFSRVLIPINDRNTNKDISKDHISFKENTPFCNKSQMFMKYNGVTKGKGRSTRLKFLCPLSKPIKGKYRCQCPHPCSKSHYGRTVYTYPKNYRDFPGLFRGAQEFNQLYKTRTRVETSISSLKLHYGLNELKTRNIESIKSDLLFACISQIVCVFVAYNSAKINDYKSITRLFKAS